ncbi:MAG: type IV toxin-antitoxin system AbiEi family antitoxin [Verrucomicrobia bacterium]|nr:type IV toxin-antitoxin system AbiEi family antitoxin [Verrucomicrobiota bacterium]
MPRESLSEFANRLQSGGRYTFTKTEAQKATGLRANAFKIAAWRLQQQKRIAGLRRGFYVIVPMEYRAAGILPPDWFVDDLMKFIGQPYYVGLLSAAALHGAAHQQPQVYCVVTSKPVRVIEAARVKIRFYKKADLQATPTVKVRTFTGDIPVSNPAATALDLVAYEKQVGGLDRVMTVLQELGESINAETLVQAAEANPQLAFVQRLGWLLDKAGFEAVTGKLRDWLGKRGVKPVVLDTAQPAKGFPRDPKWSVIVNTEVEGDL